MFEKSPALFPSKERSCFLSHCAVSPLYVAAASAAAGFQQSMVEGGLRALGSFADLLPRFRRGFAALFDGPAENISFVHSTAEALCQIANGYPFAPGDQVVSYVHEYPSNHYPWALQQRRGVELVLLPDARLAPGAESGERPTGWSMKDLKRVCGPRTRVVALSHVQFTSGYTADLIELGTFCRERGIDLIIDAAQSLGCLPVYPERWGISAVAASGWKWLMGPKGAAVLYTAPQLRERLSPVMAGPGMMRQQFDYLDHRWNPFADGRLFEYSTLPWDHVAALAVIAEDIFGRAPIETIRDEVFRLQDRFLEHLDHQHYRPLLFEPRHRSGIISLVVPGDAQKLVQHLDREAVVVTERGGYLRVAPHFYMDDEQLITAAVICNRLGGALRGP